MRWGNAFGCVDQREEAGIFEDGELARIPNIFPEEKRYISLPQALFNFI